jgi:hypothetical protein
LQTHFSAQIRGPYGGTRVAVTEGVIRPSAALVSVALLGTFGREARAQGTSPVVPETELMLQAGAGMFPYLGASALATLRTGPLAIGTSFSVGTTFYGAKVWDATAGIGYGRAWRGGGLTLLPVVGILRGENVAVAADCGFFGVGQCDSGMTVSEPFLGVRAQLFGRKRRLLAGGVFGLDYTLHPASREYQRCSPNLFTDDQTCSTASTSMTRVLLTLELTLGSSVL